MGHKQSENLEIVAVARGEQLLRRVEENVSAVPSDTLIPLYTAASAFSDRLQSVMKQIKQEIIKFRLDDGTPWGDKNQHRRFSFGGKKLAFQKKVTTKLNEEAAEALLRKKDLWERSSDTVLTVGTAEMRKVLTKYGDKIFKGVKVQAVEVINEQKLKALVDLGEITLEELESLISKSDSFAVKEE